MAQTTTNGKPQDTTVADLSAQIEVLRKDLSELTGTIAGLGKTKSAELSEAARQKGAETVEFLSTRAREAQTQASSFVAQQPATALGIAAGAGFLVGFLSSRR